MERENIHNTALLCFLASNTTIIIVIKTKTTKITKITSKMVNFLPSNRHCSQIIISIECYFLIRQLDKDFLLRNNLLWHLIFSSTLIWPVKRTKDLSMEVQVCMVRICIK